MHVYVVYETEIQEDIWNGGMEEIITKIISVRATEDAAKSDILTSHNLDYKKMILR